MWYCYIVICSDGTYYTGITTNIESRIEKHNEKHGAKYTRSRLPVVLVYSEKVGEKSIALKREIQIKKLSRIEKMRLIKTEQESNKTE